MLKLFRQRAQKQKYADREFPESEFLPYKYHWNNHTLLTKSDDLMQVIKFGGFSFETADDEDVDILDKLGALQNLIVQTNDHELISQLISICMENLDEEPEVIGQYLRWAISYGWNRATEGKPNASLL